MKNKSVGFNIESEEERQLMEYCERVSNFSKYVKTLLRMDMMRRQQQKAAPQAGAAMNPQYAQGYTQPKI